MKKREKNLYFFAILYHYVQNPECLFKHEFEFKVVISYHEPWVLNCPIMYPSQLSSLRCFICSQCRHNSLPGLGAAKFHDTVDAASARFMIQATGGCI